MSTKTSYLDIVSLVCNPILSTGRLVWKLTQEENPKVEKIIDLIWKRTGICAETKERKESEKLYPKLVDTGWNGNNRVLYYRLPPGLSYSKVITSMDDIVSYLKHEVIEKYLEKHPKAHFSLTILSGQLYDYIEYSNEETLIKDNGLYIPIGWSRRRLEQINFAEESSCHLLIGGGTGAGKSKLARFIFVTMHMKYTPDQVRLWLCDLKHGNDIDMLGENPRLVERKVREPEEVEPLVNELSEEIKRRAILFKKAKCSDFKGYSKNHKLHRIIFFVDEFTRLELKEYAHIREKIGVLTGEARSAGIHVIISCHRPIAKLIPGTMKMNMNSVVAFRSNPVSARVLLGEDDWKKSMLIDENVEGRALLRNKDDVLVQVPYVKDEVCTEIMSQYQKIIDIKAEIRPTEIIPIQTV